MPIDRVRALAVRDAVGQVLWDAQLYQGIFNVSLERAPTRVRFTFFTFWPCFARVEIFRMVHGELSLDMEKTNLVRTEIELFGNPKTSHSLLVTELEQERRYWYRISVPRRNPDFPDATGHVRSRGEFFTPRRNISVTVNRIHVFDDSDTSGDGELDFSLGLYDAGGARQRLVEPRLSPEFGVASGADINRPFGPGGQSIDRAPDFIGIYVSGIDDDTTFWGAPWYGLGLVGRRPPDTMPDAPVTWSRTYADGSDALAIVPTGGKMGRQESRFDFNSVHGRLHFSVHGGLTTEVFDTLQERGTPPWKMVTKSTMRLDAGGRFAGLIGFEHGNLALALDETNHVVRGDGERPGIWHSLDGPPLASLAARATRQGGLVLVGRDADGVGHAAHLREPWREQPCWSALGRMSEAAPAVLEDPAGRVHIVLLYCRQRLWHTLLGPGPGRRPEPERLFDEPAGAPVLHAARDGRLVVAAPLARGGLVVLTLDEAGRPVAREVQDGAPLRILAIVAVDDETAPLIVAIDREEQVQLRPLDAEGAAFEPIGSLEHLLEGPDLAASASDTPPTDLSTAA